MVVAYLRKFPELIPLFVCVSAGCVGCSWFVLRTAMYSPDASFDKKNNPEPWNRVKHNEQRMIAFGGGRKPVGFGNNSQSKEEN